MLLDTYAWVEFFKGTEKGNTIKKILRENQCFTCAISIAELSEWIERDNLDRKKIIHTVKNLSSILGLDEELLELAGILKVKKRKNAKDFGMIDAIILATGKQYNFKILTEDKHFKRENVEML